MGTQVDAQQCTTCGKVVLLLSLQGLPTVRLFTYKIPGDGSE